MPDWSRSKYKRFIDAAGGWDVFQGILQAAADIASKHGVSLSNVATRWVLEHEAVAAAIIGARLGESEHRADNLAAFGFTLDAEDKGRLEDAFAAATPIPGDCGDEYRRPPYLTASGDLSHHLDAIPSIFTAEPVPGRPDRLRVSSGSVWEPIAGYSRAVRVKDTIRVSGTTATHGGDRCVAPGDAGAQTTYILDKIAASISALGGSMEDVVRTRIYLRDASKMGAGVARPWPGLRRDQAGQHAGPGGRPGRRLRGRDRGRGCRLVAGQGGQIASRTRFQLSAMWRLRIAARRSGSRASRDAIISS